ncbi:type II secretion system F family protein [Rhodovulum adriaticum]|uniref:Tight adherence protein C n=1 Tax=Rhodovulum adriaticum TaxID=35804 RepID=A0A4R2NMB1_RHOAD|nr:type II secretion system F family protein [Rhodovulum adriaticum]MBK1636940.1 pilus assembly protein TadC [Rhodovulum adriaticum]TCP22740.1 tight adherence protein C [Rhodovulum adriaticum]
MALFNAIQELLVERFGPLGPIYAVGALAALLMILALPSLLRKSDDPLNRLKEEAQGKQRPEAKPNQQRLRPTSRADKLDRYSSFLEPQDEEELSAARLRLLQAGYRSRSAVRTFHFAQFALGIAMLVLGALYAVIASATGDVAMSSLISYLLIPGAIGYYLPKYWVQRRLQTRQQEIINGFPDSLDMLLVCVEAGQSLDQSIVRVSREIRAGFPDLADEYEIVAHELKAGKDKIQVLKDMSERCGVPDVASFVTVLIQSASFGTSIAEALRVYAGEMRDKRVMRAEEKANVLPTKLTLGTMMFTVPPLMIILIGPSVYSIYDTLTDSSLF